MSESPLGREQNMPTDNLGGFHCPDDNYPIFPHGGILDVRSKTLVFWGICTQCLKEGRTSKVIAKVDLGEEVFQTAYDDGMVWCIIAEGER